MEHVLDHEAQAEALLPESGKRIADLVALVRAAASETQGIEDALWQLYTERRLAVAAGDQLDAIGATVGQRRNGFDDTTYRAHIEARIRVTRSNGTIDDLLGILRAVVPAPTTLALTEGPPAGFTIVAGVTNFAADLVVVLGGLMRGARGAGIRGVLEYMSGVTNDTAFTFDGGGGLGFGDATNPATGGGMAGSID
jgi:hypothetical protein